MLVSIGSFLTTLTGKAVLSTAVIASGVGGLHAAEIVEVPLLPDSGDVPAVIDVPEDDDADRVSNHGEVVSSFAASTELEGCRRGQAVAGVARGVLDPESVSFDTDLDEFLSGRCADEESTDPEAPGPDDRTDDRSEVSNHGEVVSSFATSTELEGCRRGQAVAGVARGVLDPESVSFDTDLDEFLSGRCADEESTDPEAPSPDDRTDDGEQDGAGPPEWAPGPPEWARGHGPASERGERPGRGNGR